MPHEHQPLSAPLAHLATLLVARLRSDPELASSVASALAALAETLRPVAPAAAPAVEPPKPAEPVFAPPPPEPKPDEPRGVTTLKLGDLAVQVSARGTEEELKQVHRPLVRGPKVIAYEPVGDDAVEPASGALADADGVAARCRAKAEALRHGDADHALVARAKKLNLELTDYLDDLAVDDTDELAANLDAVAVSAELLAAADLLGDPLVVKSAFDLAGEAQSALRVAHHRASQAGAPDDSDQLAVFYFLRRETKARQIYIPWLALTHPGDPTRAGELMAEAAALLADTRLRHHRGQARRGAPKKVEYDVKKFLDAEPAERDDRWRRLWQNVGDALDAGVPTSDKVLRAALQPLVDSDAPWPDTDEAALGSADLARVAERVIATLEPEEEAEPEDVVERPASATLQRVRGELAGKVMVLIGGQPREENRRSLERGLQLGELRWLRVEHHQSFDTALTELGRGDVDLVAVMTRWRSHRDGPAARKACRDHGVRFFELPAGYGTEQVAEQYVRQLGENNA